MLFRSLDPRNFHRKATRTASFIEATGNGNPMVAYRETIRRKVEKVEYTTEPLASLYGSRGLLVRVDGIGDVDEVTERIMTALAPYAAV